MDAVREQMMKDLQLKGITPGTQKKYLREIGFMADYFDKPLEELGEKEVKDYEITHGLIVERYCRERNTQEGTNSVDTNKQCELQYKWDESRPSSRISQTVSNKDIN